MNKQEFLAELGKGLSGLPQSDIEDRLSFYGEMIADRMEEGLTEEEAVAEIGPADEVVSQIVAETPLLRLVKERVRPKRRLNALEAALLVLGSPIWLSLLIAGFALLLSLYAVLWALVVCLWAVWLALIAGAVGGIALGVLLTAKGEAAKGVLAIGAGLVCAGLAVLLFRGCLAASKGAAKLTGSIAVWVKSLFIGKESSK